MSVQLVGSVCTNPECSSVWLERRPYKPCVNGSNPFFPITLTEVYLSKSITVDGQLKENV